MFRERYKRLNAQIKPSGKLKEQVLQAVGEAETRRSRQRGPRLVLAAACVCLVLGMPVLAVVVEPVGRFFTSAIQLFVPVNRSDEDQGIRMEVVSAYIHENTAEVYITMRDLAGDCVDRTIDLYDSYSINRPFDSSASCALVAFDEATKTATFLIRIDEWGNRKIEGNKITFSVRAFLSHKTYYDSLEIPVDLAALADTGVWQDVDSFGGGGPGYKTAPADGLIRALVPSAPLEGFPVDGIELTGIGWIDGKLHIQTAIRDRNLNDNHGYVDLRAWDGTTIRCDYCFYFKDQSRAEAGRMDYIEYVFDVPKEDLSVYTLVGSFVTSGMLTQGNWSVTFPLEEAEP